MTLNVWPMRVNEMSTLAQVPTSRELVRTGIERYQAGNFIEAIAIWQQALAQNLEARDRAIIHTNLAQAYRATGNLAEAIRQWQEAIDIYHNTLQSSRSHPEPIAELIIEQAQAYSDLGQHQRAIERLESAVEIARNQENRLIEAAGLGALGNAYWASGNYDEALIAHQTSWQIAQEIKNSLYITTALNDLGNVYASRAERHQMQANSAEWEGDIDQATSLSDLAKKDLEAALNALEQSVAASEAVGGMTEVKARLNLNRLLEKTGSGDDPRIQENRDRVLTILSTQPDSREKAFALINLAESLKKGLATPGEGNAVSPSVAEILQQAIAICHHLGDRRAESFALGSLAEVYELIGEIPTALEFNQQAQLAAQEVNAADSLYRWQWQLGRILKATGSPQNAIRAYEQAIASLQTIRSDLIAASKDLQFDFRDAVEPVYRQLMDLLLTPSTANESESERSQTLQQALEILDNFNQPITQQPRQQLNQAIEVLELLKLAELENFFGDECVRIARQTIQQQEQLIDPTAAIIYSIILNDRTELIVQFPKNSQNPNQWNLKQYKVPISAETLEEQVNTLRSFLEKRSTDQYLPLAQTLYNSLIRPLEKDLLLANPKTIIFIQDGVLRKIPMAALHDGKQFLVEKYAIATTPSLTLTATAPLDRRSLEALILGLTVERPPFAPLTNVNAEATSVQKILGGPKLLDRDFTLANLQQQLETRSYPIVHMATHGKFGVDAQSTYLLAFDTRITIEQIDNVLRSHRSASAESGNAIKPVELLTLSACQTAVGDNRAALGMAGVAVRAGVKSALASLWYINDQGTVPLIEEFYTQLEQPNISKAEALRRAQLKLIEDLNYSHPAVWSPFLLIGNWL